MRAFTVFRFPYSAALLLACAAAPVAAQARGRPAAAKPQAAKLDRTKVPEPGNPSRIHRFPQERVTWKVPSITVEVTAR